MAKGKIRAHRGLVRPMKWWTRCIGPAALKQPDHGFYQEDMHRKIGMCERCLDRITDMRLSTPAEYPYHGEPE